MCSVRSPLRIAQLPPFRLWVNTWVWSRATAWIFSVDDRSEAVALLHPIPQRVLCRSYDVLRKCCCCYSGSYLLYCSCVMSTRWAPRKHPEDPKMIIYSREVGSHPPWGQIICKRASGWADRLNIGSLGHAGRMRQVLVLTRHYVNYELQPWCWLFMLVGIYVGQCFM